ncbi:dual specificity protein phosphatase 22 isoform X1 [Oryctolagus cuniculus]|uniref:dual specificity protein phosphatase 22 isoform X1 n=2 Tax=Oryctolagus cuniculus TaxID=9986 RepID=UPI0038792BE2
MGNGMNKILTGLYIGNFKDARDAEQLSKNKVTHILSVHDSARPMLEMPDLHVLEMEEPQSSPVLPPHSAHGKWRQGVKYLCIPAADSPSQNLTRHFKESIKFIHECRLQGEGCLVHCLAGVSRSVTLVIAYIMTVTDFGWEDALHTVRAGRSCANPNLGFQRQLQEFEKHEVQQYRQWLKEEYGESPLRDAEEAKSILVLVFGAFRAVACWLRCCDSGKGGGLWTPVPATLSGQASTPPLLPHPSPLLSSLHPGMLLCDVHCFVHA